jgi:quinoprotein glucose dehydrogenase
MVEGVVAGRSADVDPPGRGRPPAIWIPTRRFLSAPPFGELVAVDGRGEVAWKVPLGFIASLKARGFDQTGTLNLGGSIATAGGLIFIGATIDCRFRAFESRTGKQLWETELPACAHTTPMTFLGNDGRQYVVVAAGGGSYLGAAGGSKIVAFALPRAGGGRRP